MHFTPAKGVMLQISYPKCGTHWMQYLTLVVLNEGRPIRSYQEFVSSGRSLEYACVEDWKPSNGERELPYRALMTHLDPPTKNRLNVNAKYVYVARNPWDYGTFNEFLTSFLRGDFGYGDYFDHLLAGYGLKEEPNVLFVSYEELKRGIRSVVLKLAYILGERYGRALETDEHLLRTLLERATVERMRNVLFWT
ncbi:hypothetical protein HPB49_010138 [Dermacentor silvarum]|uniref:Uncharacterized protein n=1 Tax=Dermacentor silvarum TaxID=543639 RepID=A0ACB8D4M6_DERSI|nr:hypothetical protein HPB49_010138 [Dermacentor silvarum]